MLCSDALKLTSYRARGHVSDLAFQIMCYPMTLSTFGVFIEYRLGMWGAVARIARWYDFMFIPMTIRAGKIMVLGHIFFQQVERLLVTSPAVTGRDILGVGNLRGHVDRMTRYASLKLHVWCVLFVTFHTIRNLPVDGVTLVASYIRVSTPILFDLITLLLVTCQTRPADLALQLQFKGGVGVRVTTPAILQVIMRFPAVAHAAVRYGTCSLGGVLNVTVQTAHLGFVQSSIGGNGFRLLRVAQNTLRIGQDQGFRLATLCGHCCTRAPSRGPNTNLFFTTQSTNHSNHSNNANDNTHRSRGRQVTKQYAFFPLQYAHLSPPPR